MNNYFGATRQSPTALAFTYPDSNTKIKATPTYDLEIVQIYRSVGGRLSRRLTMAPWTSAVWRVADSDNSVHRNSRLTISELTVSTHAAFRVNIRGRSRRRKDRPFASPRWGVVGHLDRYIDNINVSLAAVFIYEAPLSLARDVDTLDVRCESGGASRLVPYESCGSATLFGTPGRRGPSAPVFR